jgi:hypothetical protein
VVDEAVDEGDRTAGIREDGRPVGEGQVGREHKTFPFIPAADDLEEEVGRARIVGEVANLIEAEQAARRVVVEPTGLGSSARTSPRR